MRRLIALLFIIPVMSAWAIKLEGINITERAGKMSLVFNLDKPASPKIFTLTNPARIVVDIEHTELSFNLNRLHLNPQVVKRVRSGRPNKGTLRLVFEINDAVMMHSNAKKAAAQQVFSFDLATMHQRLAQQPSPPHRLDIKSSSQIPKPAPIRLASSRPLRDVIVVIDPGHGGKDPGAQGPKQNWEKDVTLTIARRLKQIIDAHPGMRAVLTRNHDEYIGLRQRLILARKAKGDVFVSIHADAFIHQDSNGASVFALSQRGATSEAARWLAAKENYSELGGVNLADLDDNSGLVRTVLIDLSQTATIEASVQMGGRVLKRLGGITRLHNHHIEQARFMVLKSPDIPSILVETGFISNPLEEKNLMNPTYQTKLTRAIFDGLKEYFRDYPPHGSHVEMVATKPHFEFPTQKSMMNTSIKPSSKPAVTDKHSGLHVVSVGESLSRIASRYHVAPSLILAANHLPSNQLKVGQHLIIPRP